MKWILGLLLLSVGFSGEISQGTLKNGMRYYLLPDPEATFTTALLIVKKPEQLAECPLIDPFFKEGAHLPGLWNCGNGASHFSYSGHFSECSLTEIFAFLLEPLKSKVLPDKVIAEARKEYEEDWEEDDPARLQIMDLLWTGDVHSIETLFEQDDSHLNQAFHALYEPSRMALFLSGPFDSHSLEQELESSFGEIVGDGLFLSPIRFKPKGPLVIALEGERIGEVFFDEEGIKQAYLYFYPFAPTYRNHVFNDLFFCMTFDDDSEIYEGTVGKLRSIGFIPCKKLPSPPLVDESLFKETKAELEEAYRNDKTFIWDKCLLHFLSDIPDELEPKNQNLLRELETVTIDEFRSFFETKIIEDIPVYPFMIIPDEWDEDDE